MRGNVTVTTRERISEGKLTLDVFGKEVAFIRRAGLLASCASGFNDVTTFFEQHPVLSDFKETPLEPGTSSFPFSVYLPDSLPPSMKYQGGDDGDCSIEYTAGADLDGVVTTRRITVVGAPLSTKHYPNNVEPMCFPLRSRGFRDSDSLSFAARVENSHIEKGKPFNLSIAHRNQSRLEVQRVDLRLVETVSWKVGSNEKARSLLLSTHKGVGLSRRGTPKVHIRKNGVVRRDSMSDGSVAASEYTFTSQGSYYPGSPARRGSLTFSDCSGATVPRRGSVGFSMDGSMHRRGSMDGSTHRRGSMSSVDEMGSSPPPPPPRRGSMSSVDDSPPAPRRGSMSSVESTPRQTRRGSADNSVASRRSSANGSVSRRGSLGSRFSQVVGMSKGSVPRRRSMFGGAGSEERHASLVGVPPPPPGSPPMSPPTPRRRRSLFGSAGSESSHSSIGNSVRSKRRGSFLGGTPNSEITRKSLVDDEGREHPDVENLRTQLDTVKNHVSIQIPSRSRTSAKGELVKVEHFVEAVFVFRDRSSRPRLRIPVYVFEKTKSVDVPSPRRERDLKGDVTLTSPDETAHLSDSDTCSSSEHL